MAKAKETVLFAPLAGQQAVAAPTSPSKVEHVHKPALSTWLPWALLGVAVLVLAVVLVHPFGGGHVSPSTEFRAQGRSWAAKDLPQTYADSLRIASREVREGKRPMSAIKADHVKRWNETRSASHDRRFEAMLDQIIPPGEDKATQDQRNRYADALDEEIKGVEDTVSRR